MSTYVWMYVAYIIFTNMVNMIIFTNTEYQGIWVET